MKLLSEMPQSGAFLSLDSDNDLNAPICAYGYRWVDGKLFCWDDRYEEWRAEEPEFSEGTMYLVKGEIV